jgi:diguanylate cyclase (GGDEF)-like protein/PAS domain S-box-containing protein
MQPEKTGNLGFAFICGYDGVISRVIWDDFGLDNTLVGLAHFVTIFDPMSVQKGLALFLYVKEHGAAFGWEINLRVGGELRPFCFTAAAMDDQVIVLGSAAWQGASAIYDGLSHLINEQVNSLRSISKGSHAEPPHVAGKSGLPDKFAGEIISDLLELNNRLVNAERELARKNSELRRLSAVLSKDLYLAHRVLQCSGEAVVIANIKRQVIDVNSAYTAITGFGKHESVGRPLALAEPGYDDSLFIEAIWEALENRGLWQGETLGRRKGGELFPKWLSISSVLDEAGKASHYVVIFSDISRLKHAEEKWQRLAFFDTLTGLPNRALFRDRLQQAIVNAHRSQEPLALMFIDLDDFKVVNDSLGHDAGDQLLCQAAQRIEACTRESDTICRLGGDEFTAIISGCRHEQDLEQVCQKILAALSSPFFIHDRAVRVGASIGIAHYPQDGEDLDTLTKNADAAMYAAKAAGRNSARFFSKSLGEKISRNLNLKTQIAQGLLAGEFELFLQPEVSLATGKVQSLEALLRWNHPERRLAFPDEFIPVAEDSGLIIELGEFVIVESLRYLHILREHGWADLRVAVNISRRQLAQPQLAQFIIGQLERCGLPGQALIVEVTESMVLGNLESAIHVLQTLKSHGIEAAIDDFGTGYSSLSVLRRLPVDYIKIDKSFVADADIAQESKTIIQAIAAMAKSLGLKTVAEGIERPDQERFLRKIGCDIGQGYLYSKALPFQDLLVLLQRDSTLDFIQSRRLVLLCQIHSNALADRRA